MTARLFAPATQVLLAKVDALPARRNGPAIFKNSKSLKMRLDIMEFEHVAY